MEDIQKSLNDIKEGLEQKLAVLGEDIDAKIAKGLEENANNDKMNPETKAELESMTEKFTELTERLDTFETEIKRVGEPTQSKTFGNQVLTTLKDESFQSRLAQKMPSEIAIEGGFFGVKASDMTSTNAFTNQVFHHDRNESMVIYNPDRAVHVRSLIPGGTMSGNAFEYIQETAYDDGADTVAEAGTPTQSDFDLTQQTAPARKIGTFLVVTEEMLADVPALQSYIVARVPSKVRVAEDTQILYGTGVAPDISGITVNASAYTDNLADSNIQRWDVLRDAIRQVRDDEYFANAILLHPTDFAALELSKDSQGRYILPSMLTGDAPTISGVRIFENTAMTAGDFLVGDFNQGAMVLDRQQSFIRFYEQDGNQARTGEITVKAQERLALPVWRTSAFIYGTFAAALAQGSA